MNMRSTTILILTLLHRALTAQTITYEWPGALGSIAIYPNSSDTNLMGTAPEWEHVNTCTVLEQGTSVLQSEGWPAAPGTSSLRFHVLAFTPFDLDSIIVDHKRSKNGPERFRLVLTCGELCPERTLSDTIIPDQQGTLALKINEHLEPVNGMEYGWITFKLIPYGDGDGAWQPHSVRLVASRSNKEAPSIDQQRMAQMPKRSAEPPAPRNVEGKRAR